MILPYRALRLLLALRENQAALRREIAALEAS